MSREFWTRTTKPNEIKRLNKKLIIPAFSAACGQRHFSLHALPAVDGVAFFAPNLDAGLDLHNALSGEAWIKQEGINILGGVFSYGILSSGNESRYRIYLNDSYVYVSLNLTAGQTTLQSISKLKSGQWNHVAFTYDRVKIKIYINGIFDTEVAATTAIVAGAGDYFTLGDNLDFEGAAPFVGFLSEVRVWNIALTLDQVYNKFNHPRSYGLAGIDTGLVFYAKNNEGVATTISNKISGKQAGFTLTQWEWSTEYPPLKYGASFIAAKASVANLTSSENVSLKFPLIPPSNVNFALAISWIDFNNVFQRRLLWNPDASVGNIDWAPQLVYYNGERLPPTFDFEIINIDGKATVDLASDYTIELSNTSLPNDSTDITEVSVGTLTIDKTLAQNFPLTPFPLTFNVQQTY